MVLEGVVVDLVNRFLGDFIENLDKSQLSIGIWGGDILLNNLFVKENLLDDLDLPIRVTYGNIGQLRLKIPWKNLYTEPTVAELDGLYIIAVPNSTIVYNEEKEKKAAWDTKQKELLRIEEAKKKQAEKDLAKDAAQDTFAEKLITNIIKNLEVKITNIHVRYEDKFTNPKKPFSVGVTLREISCLTTDANWKVSVIKEATVMIHKLLKMDSLSLYWNVGDRTYAGQDRNSIQSLLKEGIADASKKTDFMYLMEPMSSLIRLRLNTKPDQDGYVTPKILLEAVFEEIAVVLSRCQYQILMEFLDSLERMQLGNKYRKYRPDVTLGKENWWRFAYVCVLEETVRRRRAMWSWHNIKEHRKLCRRYKEIYKNKLLTPKPSAGQLSDLEQCEKKLDVFNITMMRHQAELEIKKEGLKQKKEESGRWFGGWFSRSSTSSDQQSVGAKVQDIIMSQEEKQKLYEAIGYQENVDTVYPVEFVASKLCVKLKSVRIKLQDTDSTEIQEVLNLHLNDASADLIQRPAASAVRVNMSIDSVQLSGVHVSNEASKPILVSSGSKDFGTLLDLVFETHPMEGECDARIKVWSMPLQIVYHAKTINTLAEFFKPPEYVHIVQLQAAAMAKLERVKQQTTTGLQYALEQQKFTDVNIVLQPTCIIIPEFGDYKQNCRMLVLDLGKLVVITEKQRGASLALSSGDQSPRILSLEEITQQAYDKFILHLQSLQLLFVKSGDDWIEARKLDDTPLHILRPMQINVDFYKSVLQDVKIPKMRLFGELPTFSVSLSDRRLTDICDLMNSIPFPESSATDLEEDSEDLTLQVPDLKTVTIKEEPEEFIATLQNMDANPPLNCSASQTASEFYNATDLELKFEVKQISLCIMRHWKEREIPALKVVVESVGTELRLCTFDTSLTAYLGVVSVQHTLFYEMGSGPVVCLVNTPMIDENYNRLLSIHLLLAQKKHPEFQTLYENTLQKITVNFNSLHIQLHREALVSLIELAQMLQAATTKKENLKEPEKRLSRRSSHLSVASVSTAIKKIEPKRIFRSRSTVEPIDVALNGSLSHISVGICSRERYLAELEIIGLEAKIMVQKSRTTIEAALKDVGVFDKTSNALFPEILAFDGGEVFDLTIVVYNNGTEGANYAKAHCVDLAITLNTGCMQVIFLNKFVQDLLRFLNQFQAAKERISAASSAVADRAAVAAQDLSQKSTRLSLDIRLKAPVVIVPQNSRSQNSVAIDLGRLRVTNTFQILSQKDSAGLPAVLDNMVIDLTSMKISRAFVDGITVKSERLILAPVTLKVCVTRNLSSFWYKGHPDIEISGHLCNFSILLSQGDYKTLMLLLSENLQEGVDDPGRGDEVEDTIIEASEAVSLGGGIHLRPSSLDNDLQSDPLRPDQAAIKPSKPPDVYSTLKANFAIERVELELFTGETDLAGGAEHPDGSKSLAKLLFQLVTVSADMRSDQSMTATVSLQTCKLHDSRPSRQAGITRLISQSKKMNGQSNMANLKYEQLSNLNKNVTMEVNGLYVLVCLEHLMKLSDFFVKGLPETKPAATSADASKLKTSPMSEVAPQLPPSEPLPSGEMEIRFSLNQPEVLLVEDAMKSNTNTLVLDLQLDFAMTSSPIHQIMNGSIKNLSIVSSVYQSKDNDLGRTQILSPISVRLNSNATVGKTQLIEVTLSDVILTVSASSLRIIASTLSSLSVQEAESTEDELSKISKDLWTVKSTKDCQFWFLKQSETVGKRSPGSGKGTPRSEKFKPPTANDSYAFQSQQLVLSSSRIIVKFMGGIDKRTIPFIIAEVNLSSVDIKDWSSKLNVSCQMSLEVAYFNEKLAAWEPLIEPAELGDQKNRPWQLNVKVFQNPLVIADDEDGEIENPALAPPLRSIRIVSRDILEVTVTKTALEVFQSLGKSFSEAYYLVDSSSTAREDLEAPYLLKNESGMFISARLGDEFKFPPKSDGTLTLDPGQSIQLFDRGKVAEKSVVGLENIYNDSLMDLKAKKIYIMFEDLAESRMLRIMKAEKRSFSITPRGQMGSAWQLVAQLDTVYGCKIITLRSAVQVHNTLPFTMEIYYRLSNDAMARCGQVEPHDTISLPCDAVYAESNEVFFRPTGYNGNESYCETREGCGWKDLSKDFVQMLECQSSTDEVPRIYFVAKVAIENVFHEYTDELSARTYVINLFPTVIFRNLLPLPVVCKIEDTDFLVTIEPGAKAPLLSALPDGSAVAVSLVYQSCDWIGRHWIESKPSTLTVLTFDSFLNGDKLYLDLSLHSESSAGYLQLSLHSPYWMINKTGQDLMYKAGDSYIVQHPADTDETVFFLFKKSSSASAKKASLKLGDCAWSDKFSLDTVGSVGSVLCQHNGQSSTIGVKIELSSSGLTKIITFTPYFVVANESKFGILFKEHAPGTVWNEVRPGECIAFWPVQTATEKQMVACIKDTALETVPFLITESHTTLLQLYHSFGGINVECQVMEGLIRITFQHYYPGFSAALLVNHTHNHTVNYHQLLRDERSLSLGAGQSALYTWQDPCFERELVWSCGKSTGNRNELLKDGTGEFFVDEGDNKIYWISFLDGMQRVLLFTDDYSIVEFLEKTGGLERIDQEIVLSLQGFGVSLVNNLIPKEVAYFAITNSGVIWEQKKRKRFRAVKTKYNGVLESGYQKYLSDVSSNPKSPGRRQIDVKLEADYSSDPITLYKPQAVKVRRSFEYGIWLQYRTSQHQTQLHLKIHRLQLDNQLTAAVFPTVLSPVPPPKSVAAESVPKPFTELSVMIRKSEHSDVMQFKYCRLLIQEMAVKVDQGFLNALLSLFSSGIADETQQLVAFRQECALVNSSLPTSTSSTSASNIKHFYDSLHCSPLKVHLSFSLYGGDEVEGEQKPEIQWNIMNLFLQSVGIVLTDIQDVIFKLAFFERNYVFFSQSQLTQEIIRHYSQQAIRQMYVLVLGLDVLGNPFGLIRGLSAGIEDFFYEPYQGAIQGPEEFAEGLAIGVKSLLGHAVGGAAGAVSRITGALGKGIATLTLDEDYQKKRREALSKRPADFKEGLARGGKGLVMGVVHGVTGVVTQPMEGAKKEGVGGFFKGVGKGIVGVFTRPVSGVVDFASSSFEGIRRVTDLSDEVQKLRPTRFIHTDGIIRPFRHRDAEGHQILLEVEKGKYASDMYLGHLVASGNAHHIFIGTDKRVIFTIRGDIMGHWDCEWEYTWDLLREPPSLIPKGIQIILKEKQKKFFGSGIIGKVVAILEKDRREAEVFINRIRIAMNASS